jgi:hypothetical protein
VHIRGSLGIVLLDTRFDRVFRSHRFVSDDQLAMLSTALLTTFPASNVSEVIVASSVPLLYESGLAGVVARVVDGERYASHPAHRGDALAAISTVLAGAALGSYKVTLVAGDFHMHLRQEVCDPARGVCVDSIISSGITRGSTTLKEPLLLAFAALCQYGSSARLYDGAGGVVTLGPVLASHFGTNFMSADVRADGTLAPWEVTRGSLDETQRWHMRCFWLLAQATLAAQLVAAALALWWLVSKLVVD